MGTGIGERLRSARQERGVELGEVEAATRIRGRFLEAIEEGQWDVLPGPAYAVGFLRTYAEFLGLDPGPLVAEYHRLHEPQAEEPEPEAPLLLSEEQLRLGLVARALRWLGLARASLGEHQLGERLRRGLPSVAPAVAAGIAIAAVVAIALVVTITAGSGEGNEEGAADAPAGEDAPAEEASEAEPAPSRVEVELRATGTVWVCMVDDRGKPVVDSLTLSAGAQEGPFQARAFEATFGNGQVELQANGEPVPIPESANPLGYRVTAEKAKELSPSARPTCT